MGKCRGWPHLMVSGLGCDSQKISDKELIYYFLKTLPEKIGMKALGDPVIYDVTEKDHPDTGVTAFQVITTSHISYHGFDKGQSVGISNPISVPFFTFDLYSCHDFDSSIVINWLVKTFEPKDIEEELIFRLRTSGIKQKERRLWTKKEKFENLGLRLIP